MDINIRTIEEVDKEWIKSTAEAFWYSSHIVSRGKLHNILELSGFVAEIDNEKAGLAVYQIENNTLEIVGLASIMQGKGVGSHLLDYIIKTAKENTCQRVWLVTTNDNMDALHFYQKRGFQLSALYKDVIKDYRKIKPEIPATGLANIPLRDEIELELLF